MAKTLSPEKVQHLGAAVPLPPGCPMRDPQIDRDFADLVRRAGRLSVAFQQHLDDHPDAAGWLRATVDTARPVLRPWAMELLFLLGVHGASRFGDLEQRLGISSKVLSTRLRELAEAGQVARHVEATTPVRIEYRLSKAGRATAALAAPLFAHLNLVATATDSPAA